MSKINNLLKKVALVAKENTPIFSLADLALMLSDNKKHISVILHRACKEGVMEKVANGYYISTLTPPDATIAIYAIAQKMREHYLSYISLESQLSYTGNISQIPIDRLTMMTTGRKGIFKTTYGTIEFTHTKRHPLDIANDLYFDQKCKVWRATPERAYRDLLSVNRNIDMVTGEIC